MKLRKIIILTLALGATSWSQACVIPGLSHELAFDPNNTDLSVGDVRSVADWYVGLRDGPLGIDDISVTAYSIKGNAASAVLTRARVDAVARLLRTLISTNPIRMESDVVPTSATKAQAFPEIRISVQPLCAKTHSCCGSDPNLR